MSTADFGSLLLLLLVLVGLAHLLGNLAARFGQPRVIGEILTGVLLSAAVLGHFSPTASSMLFPEAETAAGSRSVVLGLLYNLGLLMLMFCSGTETKGLFDRKEWRQVFWLALVGTGLPFVVAMMAAGSLPLDLLIGTSGKTTPLMLIIAMAVAVTSIPVISKIMYDLKILHTRFARLILAVAVLEDIVLWAILALAVPLAKTGVVAQKDIAMHLLAVCAYLGLGLLVMPGLLRWLGEASWNVFARTSPVAYVFSVLLAYAAVAAAFDISLVFAAFLAGFGVTSKTTRFEGACGTIGGFSFAIFIPIYFAIVGYKLDFTRTFSVTLLLAALVIACVVKLGSAGLGAKLAGFKWKDCLNLSMALNARGGPGIVLASVAFDANIINASFYTTLVLVAILTSQMAGAWLERVLRRDGRLLSQEPRQASSARRADLRPSRAA